MARPRQSAIRSKSRQARILLRQSQCRHQERPRRPHQILCQDDYLFDETAIERTVAAFGAADAWLVTSYLHTIDRLSLFNQQNPRLNPHIELVNTIGTHSCLTIRNLNEPELFAEDLIWAMDSEYYRRLYERFGPPAIVHWVTVVQMLWDGQVTNTYAADEQLRQAEVEMVTLRYPKPMAGVIEPRASGVAGVLGKFTPGLKRSRRES